LPTVSVPSMPALAPTSPDKRTGCRLLNMLSMACRFFHAHAVLNPMPVQMASAANSCQSQSGMFICLHCTSWRLRVTFPVLFTGYSTEQLPSGIKGTGPNLGPPAYTCYSEPYEVTQGRLTFMGFGKALLVAWSAWIGTLLVGSVVVLLLDKPGWRGAVGILSILIGLLAFVYLRRFRRSSKRPSGE
jgi:hypothetical protein